MLKTAPQRFQAGNLFEAINGGADRFLAYGFQELARATYEPRGIAYGEEVAIELYQMSSPLAAFGIFSLEATSCDPPEEAPGPGCSRRSDRVIYQGSVFLKLTTYADSPAARLELTRLAQATLGRVPGEASLPVAFSRFPEDVEGKPTHRAYLADSVQIDIPGLGDAYRVDYETDTGRFGLYLHSLADGATAVTQFAAAHKTLVADAGSPSQPLPGVGDEAILVSTPDGVTFLFRQGADLGGGTGLKDVPAASEAARKLAASLARQPTAPPAPGQQPAAGDDAAAPEGRLPPTAGTSQPAPAEPHPATTPPATTPGTALPARP
ncbi:MAG: hypothetical protein FJ125_07070 [Deltaproteobacteria bacterium]|nr:hypothetical protein [Deltaproteobacteria bacterium]